MKARYYQTEAVAAVWDYFESKRGSKDDCNPLVLMPTATGKSVVIALLIKSIFDSYFNQKVLVLTHVKELVGQNYERLKQVWPGAPAGINSEGLKQRDYHSSIIFAGIGSVKGKPELFGKVDLVLVDECDLISPSENTTYMKFLSALRKTNPYLRVIGFTATAWRTGQGHLVNGGIFTDVCYDITSFEAFNRLLDEGYLCNLIPPKTKLLLDVSGVGLVGGEFNQGKLAEAVDKDDVTWAALQETAQWAQDRKHWLIFAQGVHHALKIGEMLTYMGISNVVIHSDLSDKDRDEGIAGYKAGKYQVAVNNNVLTTGFDFPAIDLIVVLRPTMSSRLWVQMLGRGIRPLYAQGYDLTTTEGRLEAIASSDKPYCMVLDFAGNTRRLGPINDPVIPKGRGKGPPGTAPIKECPNCGTLNHAKATHCIFCRYKFDFAVKIKDEASSVDVIKKTVEPIIEEFAIDHVSYAKVQRLPNPPAMQATYFSGLRRFKEIVCFEHEGYPGRAAGNWWKARTSEPMPVSTDWGLAVADKLPVPTFLRVWTNNKPYPQIVASTFDPNGFKGTEL
jgi:DNA repair protein RadD